MPFQLPERGSTGSCAGPVSQQVLKMMQTRGHKLDPKALKVTPVFTAPADTDADPPVYIPVEAVHPPLRSKMEG